MANDLLGKKIGKLTVIGRAPNRGKLALWICRCTCGNKTTVLAGNLSRGHTRSCGCLWEESITKHGYVKHPLYSVWKDMKARCLNPRDCSYRNYGGRGVTVCSAWLDPRVFILWALNHGYRKGLTLDRRNNNGNYTPRNCRFVTRKIQQRNQRQTVILCFRGKSKPMADWLDMPRVKRLGVDKNILRSRLRYGWTVKQALTLPVMRGHWLKYR